VVRIRGDAFETRRDALTVLDIQRCAFPFWAILLRMILQYLLDDVETSFIQDAIPSYCLNIRIYIHQIIINQT
jgi:hypothetical protein